jgi:hypothetical protein
MIKLNMGFFARKRSNAQVLVNGEAIFSTRVDEK